ncbi:MAG: amino acid permease, partial [Candidatus Solibacter usitatus]|nr:amino acid permease [Candidatus Solibacter usitatus]
MHARRRLVGLRKWLLGELRRPEGPHGPAVHKHPWWQVMCLTGVDYFSTLGYQPGIAALAAGVLSPLATFILVLVTLFAAYPVYGRVAGNSFEGQGSISMLERLFPRWKGKALVLCLLGFAATDFVITMTLSAADATAHIMENPFVPAWMHHKIGLTLLLLALLSGVFLKGFREAIGLAVALVGCYLALNLVVVAEGVRQVLAHPETIANWRHLMTVQHGNPLAMLGVGLLLFPKLALGLSGFETGVAVMPLIQGDVPERIRNTRKLLLTAALIMSVFLIASSLVTTLLIEPKEFQPGGNANGRALAFLAHRYLGEWLGTIYDVGTIAI